jgi:hypothetical protein
VDPLEARGVVLRPGEPATECAAGGAFVARPVLDVTVGLDGLFADLG